MKIKAMVSIFRYFLSLIAVAALAQAKNENSLPHHVEEPIFVLNKCTFSIASNITVSIDILPEAKELAKALNIFPNGATIDPLGHTTVMFSITGLEISNATTDSTNSTNLTSFPIVFVVPITTYMNLPITGSVAQTLMIAPGSSIAVQGLTTSITRVLYGFSRQTFPQLKKVVISKSSPDWPYYMTEISSFQIPSLI